MSLIGLQIGNRGGAGGAGAVAPLTLTAPTATDVPLTLKAAAAQTENLLEMQNSAGGDLAYFNNTGDLYLNDRFLVLLYGTETRGGWHYTQGGFMATPGAAYCFTNGNNFNTIDGGFQRHAAGVVRFRGTTDVSIRGLYGGGAAVASAAALPVPTGRVFHVTGTTNITSITSTNFEAGAVITLIFDGALTFTDGNNLKLAGNFVTTADDTITLVYDGTNWYEICRSVN